MRTIETESKTLLAGGRFIERDAILFDFLEGTYGFWWGEGPFSWNGITFTGAGRLLDIPDISGGGEMPTEIDVTLSAIPDSGLTPDVLGTIEDYTYHLRPVVLYRFLFSPSTGAMVGTVPIVLFRGQVDQIAQVDDPDGRFTLLAKLVSRAVDYRKTGYLKRGNETQALIAGETDLGFEHAARAAQERAQWGQG
jgi:hypothetical protein